MPTGNPFTTQQAPMPMNMSEYAIAQNQIVRQQKLADALRKQSMTPDGGTEMVSGWAVKKSPWEAVSKIVQGIAANLTESGIDERERQLAKDYQAGAVDAMKRGSAAQYGTEAKASSFQPDTFDEADKANFGDNPANPDAIKQGGAMATITPGEAADPSKAIAIYMQHPATQQMAQNVMNQTQLANILKQYGQGSQDASVSSDSEGGADYAKQLAAALTQGSPQSQQGASQGPVTPQGRGNGLLGGVNPAAIALASSQIPGASQIAGFVNDANKPTDFTKLLQQAGIDPNSQLGRQVMQQQIAKQNNIPLVAGRAGAPMYNPDGTIAAMAPKIPDSAIPRIENGQVTGVSPLPGAAGVEQINSYATQAGKNQAEPIAGFDANNNPAFTNKLSAAQSQPTGQGPQGAFAGDPNAIRSQINRISDPTERAAAQQAFDNQMQSSGGGQIRPGLSPGFDAFQNKVAGTSADLASKTLTIASTAPQRINILDNILDLSKSGVATGPGADFQNSVKGYIANTPGIAGMFPKGWQGNVADYQELTKFMNQNASQAWQAAGGTGTDAQLEMQTKANVNNKMFPQALQGVAQWAKAGEMAAMSKANLMQKTQAMQSPQALQQFEMQWRNNFDPKVFQLQIMSPQEQQAFVKRLQPTEAAALAKKRSALMQMGAF